MARSHVSGAMAFALLATACSSGGGGGGVATSPPAGLQYADNPVIYPMGSPIAPNTPASTGGAIVSYAIAPALPNGLVLDSTSGIVTGTPTVITAIATYIVTASNAAGATSRELVLVVTDALPEITYPSATVAVELGGMLSPFVPINSGGAATSWTIDPTLPLGLAMSPTTGAIAGSPIGISPSTTYTVTATNDGGSDQTAFDLTVTPPPPVIGTQPSHTTVAVGATATFAVIASGTGTLSYQWWLDGTAIPGATSSAYTTPATVVDDDGGIVRVVIADGFGGEVTSAAAILGVVGGGAAATTALPAAKRNFTVNSRADGRILCTGGVDNSGFYFASTYLFDPGASTWSGGPTMTQVRSHHTATALRDGRLLVIGSAFSATNAELGNAPATAFTATTGSLTMGRSLHTVTGLSDGRALVVGGNSATAMAELYIPGADAFLITGSLATGRDQHTATLLADGRVLVVGGTDGSALASAELYDPDAGTFSATGSLATARACHFAALLPDGRVLVGGGLGAGHLDSCEIWDPATGTFSATGSLATARTYAAAMTLANGRVLAIAGNNSATLTSCEVFEPRTGSWHAAGDLAVARTQLGVAALPDGGLLIPGGTNSVGIATNATDVFDPGYAAPRHFSAAGTPAVARQRATPIVLGDGRVLVAGGMGTSTALASAEL
ncbi:MAG: putative Ig domain-containing protein, partial [Planctomycetes bacterium]|nr:putative Ig domain-containing protein [Planctomycetota bacterium]